MPSTNGQGPKRAILYARVSTDEQSRLFFFSSRRRHTISLCDWSSDVCSSDLTFPDHALVVMPTGAPDRIKENLDRKSVVEGKSVDLACRRIIREKKRNHKS